MDALTTHYRERCEAEPDPVAKGKMIDDLRAGLREQLLHSGHLTKEIADMHSKLGQMKETVHSLNDLIRTEKDS